MDASEEAPSTKLRRGTPISPAPRHVARPSVLLVDPDRFGRSSLARALVSGSCDVTVIDDVPSAMVALGGEPPHVVVTEVAGLEIEALLHAMAVRHPVVPVVAWTRVPRANVEHLMRSAGVASFDVLAKASRTVDVLATVRRLVAG
jgi:DNA-binding NtrC family response regulator